MPMVSAIRCWSSRGRQVGVAIEVEQTDVAVLRQARDHAEADRAVARQHERPLRRSGELRHGDRRRADHFGDAGRGPAPRPGGASGGGG